MNISSFLILIFKTINPSLTTTHQFCFISWNYLLLSYNPRNYLFLLNFHLLCNGFLKNFKYMGKYFSFIFWKITSNLIILSLEIMICVISMVSLKCIVFISFMIKCHKKPSIYAWEIYAFFNCWLKNWTYVYSFKFVNHVVQIYILPDYFLWFIYQLRMICWNPWWWIYPFLP